MPFKQSNIRPQAQLYSQLLHFTTGDSTRLPSMWALLFYSRNWCLMWVVVMVILMVMYLYTEHITWSHGDLQFLWGEIGRQHVKAPLEALGGLSLLLFPFPFSPGSPGLTPSTTNSISKFHFNQETLNEEPL